MIAKQLNNNLVVVETDDGNYMMFPNMEEFENYRKQFSSRRFYLTKNQYIKINREFFKYSFDSIAMDLPYMDKVPCYKLLIFKIKKMLR